MKVDALWIENFRGIKDVALDGLGNMIVVAGQNGSGKSCIFDAIRLLKSVYGGYQPNEWQQWMGEFKINLSNRSSDFAPLFNNPARVLRIACHFRLAQEERAYIQAHADELIREKIWRTILPEAYEWGGLRMALFAAQFRDREQEVAERVFVERPILMDELAGAQIRGALSIAPGDVPRINKSLVLAVVFSTFRPSDIGVIDYHGAQRHYGREQVSGISLNLDAAEKQQSQSALYNYGNKYNNVKTEMAASYVREILAEQAGMLRSKQATLTNTLAELFATFFPHKRFVGPRPTRDGSLEFPVITQDNSTHDLDELSAGEKEILYGYLRIRNSAPKNSIILLDEPELHLNPRLIRGLPQFYRKNLGEALNNQIWLVTHSDALLREVVGRDSYNVYHMLPCSSVPAGQSQLRLLSATADLDMVLVDLLGDLASYRPGGKVVIFEGGGDSDFDQRMTSMLFPELQEAANLISGSNKVRVRALQEILERASEQGKLPFKFYSITDRDSESRYASASSGVYSWDVYHIENYFLEASFINKVLGALNLNAALSDEQIWDELRQCAQDTIPQLTRHELSEFANAELIGAINTGTDPKAADLAGELHGAIDRSLQKLTKIAGGVLTKDSLKQKELLLRQQYVESLADGSWVSKCRGRDILKRFAGKYAPTVSYEVFRNLVLAQMRDQGYKPAGMKGVVERILT